MRRFPLSLIALACVVLPGSFFVQASALQVSAAGQGRGVSERAVCDKTSGLKARCMAEVVTDSAGAAVTNPTPDPTAYGPKELHLGYSAPCVPGGTVNGSTAQYKCKATSWGPQVIAIVDAYNDPTAASDLATYSNNWGIAPCPQGSLKSSSACLTIVNETGGTKLPATNATWSIEISLDLQIAHMMDQSAKILLVEAATDNIPDLAKAEQTAASLGATQISNSYGTTGEDPLETNYDPYYTYTGVGVFAASGDCGTHGPVQYPAASQDVIAVGGTRLNLNAADDSYSGETVWGETTQNCDGWEGSGSGCSLYEGVSPWQFNDISDWGLTGCSGYSTHVTNSRAVADVAADADPRNSGAAIYDSTPLPSSTGGSPTSGWYKLGGTSMATPLVAAIAAMGPAWPAGVLPSRVLYDNHVNAVNAPANGGSDPNLHDVVGGSNWDFNYTFTYPDHSTTTSCPLISNGNPWIMCQGSPGYDGPTGLGTPNGVGAF